MWNGNGAKVEIFFGPLSNANRCPKDDVSYINILTDQVEANNLTMP